MKKINNSNNGFTLSELLIVVAIIAVLVAISIPVFTKLLEKSRESTDLANVRGAYAELMSDVIVGDGESSGSTYYDPTLGTYSAEVSLKQTQYDWQSELPITIGGVISTDTTHWVGAPGANGTCKITYNKDNGVTFIWSGEAASSAGSNGLLSSFFGSSLTSGSSSNSADNSAVTISYLGTSQSRLGSSWSAAGTAGLMSIGAASTNASASRVTLTMTPIALSNGAEVTITSEDGYQTGYFLVKYDAEKGGYVKVTDSGWKKGTVSFTVNGDGYYLVTNTKKDSGNLTVAEAESNVSLSIANNNAYSTDGMTEKTIVEQGAQLVTTRGLMNSTTSKTGGTVHETYKTTEVVDGSGKKTTVTVTDENGNPVVNTNYTSRGYASLQVTEGQILSMTGSSDYNYAYYFVNDDNTVLFDSGWLGYEIGTSIVIPQDCKLLVQVIQKTGKVTETSLTTALENVNIYE